MILNKLIKKIVLIPVLSGLIISCQDLKFGDDFLAKPPATDVTIDDIYSNAEYARRALWAAYETLPYGVHVNGRNKMQQDIIECLTDLNQSLQEGAGCGSTLYYTGNVNPDTENGSATKYSYIGEGSSGEWNWRGIRLAYLFINNVDRVPDMSDAEKERLKAEAKIIIAIHYFDMFRHFGGVPWVDHAYAPTETLEKERETALQTLNNIVGLLDEAAAVLPWKLQLAEQENWDGRLTKASAMALKAKVLLFGASPLFNYATPYLQGEAAEKHLTWYGSYMPELWQQARQAYENFFREVTNNPGSYKLFEGDTEEEKADIRLRWRGAYFNRNNGEVLISIRCRYQAPGLWDYAYYFLAAAADFGSICNPTQNLVDLFPMVNGRSIDDPASGYNPAYPYLNRDPRLYETVVSNGDRYIRSPNGRADIYVGGRHYQGDRVRGPWKSGYKLRKFLLDGGQPDGEGLEITGKPVHWPLLRLSEMYLGYAEAICQSGGDMNQAYQLVNDVRARVGVGSLKPGLTGNAFIEALMTERAIELAYEESRWFDMVRYKREDIFKTPIRWVNITRKNPSDQNPTEFNFEYRTFNPRYWQNNFSPKWYLSAFPSNEINKKYGLVQNPGWE